MHSPRWLGGGPGKLHLHQCIHAGPPALLHKSVRHCMSCKIAKHSLYCLLVDLPQILQELQECGDCECDIWLGHDRSVHEASNCFAVQHLVHPCCIVRQCGGVVL